MGRPKHCDHDLARAWLARGMSPKNIARTLGVHVRTINRATAGTERPDVRMIGALAPERVEQRRAHWDAIRERARELRGAGLSLARVAQECGFSIKTARRYCAGVTPPARVRHTPVSVPAWVERYELAEDYRDYVLLYGVTDAARRCRSLVAEMGAMP